MRTVLLALMVAAAAPAQAGECLFQSTDGWTFSIEDPSEAEYRVTAPDGSSTLCTWMMADEGTGVRLACSDGTEEFVTTYVGEKIAFAGRTYVRGCH